MDASTFQVTSGSSAQEKRTDCGSVQAPCGAQRGGVLPSEGHASPGGLPLGADVRGGRAAPLHVPAGPDRRAARR